MRTSNNDFRVKAMQTRIVALENELAELRQKHEDEIQRERNLSAISRSASEPPPWEETHSIPAGAELRMANFAVEVSQEMIFAAKDVKERLAHIVKDAAIKMVMQNICNMMTVDCVRLENRRSVQINLAMKYLLGPNYKYTKLEEIISI